MSTNRTVNISCSVGTQGAWLARDYGAVKLSSGDLLRELLARNDGTSDTVDVEESKLADLVRSDMADGG